MSQSSSLIYQAKQGNPNAIASLVNKSLDSHGIKVIKSVIKQKCLHFLLEAEDFSDREKLIKFIKSVLLKLNPNNINSVKIYGCHNGNTAPVWNAEFVLLRSNQAPNQSSILESLESQVRSLLKTESTITIRKKQDALIFFIKSSNDLEKSETCNIVRESVEKTRIDDNLTTIKIYFQKTDEDVPDWHHEERLERTSLKEQNSQASQSPRSQEQSLQRPSPVIQVEQLSYELFEKLHLAFLAPVASRNQFILSASEDPTISSDDVVRGLNIESLSSELKESLMHSSQVFKNLALKYSLDCSSLGEDIKNLFDSISAELKQEIKEKLNIVHQLGQNYLEIQEGELNVLEQVGKGATQGAMQSFSWFGGLVGAYQGYQSVNQRKQDLKVTEEQYLQAREMLFENIFSFWRQLYLAIADFCDRKLAVKLIAYQDIREKIELHEQKVERAIELLNSDRASEAVCEFESARDLFWEKITPSFADRIMLKNLSGNESLQWRVFVWANAYLENGNPQQAKYFYEMIRDNYTAIADAEFGLACVYSVEDRVEQAFDCLKSAIQKGFCDLELLDSKQALENLRMKESYTLFFANACKTCSPTGIDYSTLADYLTEKQWKKSDFETYTLICKSLKKGSESTFNNNEIEQISIADLKNIDYLWRKHSDRLYGFSIQKEIQQDLDPNTLITDKLSWPQSDSPDEFFKDFSSNAQKSSTKGTLPYTIHCKGSGWLNSFMFYKIIARFEE
ncbi:GUN4 domain-containing protein [Oscillatoria sp. FACHB-1406]|uniref:GUN4 domain-containing protein n=1 Tax=Oscillatoria sp. FACHB-1406 TaxID=2692846 RepID=UPI001683A9B6|nr:GUN4 domain-containing protein [Oscillatoria sp. FACHB-1406]